MKKPSAFLLLLLTLGCIGCHKYVFVNYEISNRSDETLYYGTENAPPDSSKVVLPNRLVLIATKRKWCWFGNCKVSLNADPYKDSIMIYKATDWNTALDIDPSSWKISGKKVILKIKGP